MPETVMVLGPARRRAASATAGRVARLVVVDCALIAVAQRTPDQNEAALRATFGAVRDLRLEGQPRR
ncbi:hypothetical protein [Streptomyces sp. NPDC051636]|uniref:hypothetical protein n=1 Tax=Streptomyces sp. NPDC051636 TaxID=3365663 RepID=UPI003793E072